MTTIAPLTESASAAERRAGFIAAASAYVMWGFLPLYLKLLGSVDVREVLAQRILWAAPAAFVAVFVMSGWRLGWREIGVALNPRLVGTLALSACFIFVNWGIYLYLVLNERVIEHGGVSECVTAGDDVGPAVLDSRAAHVAHAEVEVRLRIPFARDFDHCRREINADDFALRKTFGESGGDVAGAAGEVYAMRRGKRWQRFDEPAFPSLIATE